MSWWPVTADSSRAPSPDVTAQGAKSVAGQSQNDDVRTALSVSHLAVTFRSSAGAFRAVRDVSFEVPRGRAIGLLGESGSGKSVSTLAVLGLLDRRRSSIGGNINFMGKEFLQSSDQEMASIRGRRIGVVFQDPLSSLNPVLRIGTQITETLQTHLGLDKRGAEARAVELLEMVEITRAKDRMRSYPHELSGGMRQRVMIAIAISCNPELLIADEPTTALDVTVQAQILDMLRRLQKVSGMSMLLVTHDIGVVSEVCDEATILYAGRTVERVQMETLMNQPQRCHPYTEALLATRAPRESSSRARLRAIPGNPQSPHSDATGCAFEPRCKHAVVGCNIAEPELLNIANDHQIRCWERVK